MGGIKNALWGGQPEPDFSQQNMARPQEYKYSGLTDENGNLMDKFKLSNGEGYRGIATNKLNQSLSEGRDQAAMGAAGAQMQARNSLASRGGASGGASANLARQSMTDKLNALQGVTQTGIKGAQDIEGKTYDIGREAERYNLGNQTSDINNKNSFNENRYQQQMQEWGAGQTADAMRRNAPRPKGGILGGAVNGVGGILGK